MQIKTNPHNATYSILKYDATSNIIILYATLRPALCFSSSIIYVSLQVLFPWGTLSYFFKNSKGSGCPKNNGILVKTEATGLSPLGTFLILPLLTTVHSAILSFMYTFVSEDLE